MENEQNLSELVPGEKGVIARIEGEGATRRRLMAMGMTTGTRVEVIRKAPLGDPIDFMVKGYHLSLRKAEAEQIIVNQED
ncbi:MAG: ferrous iron transport protein A [Thermoplasmata archaeon]|nr:ferrous iron transport protein A [Thermoplasmata archaeon]